VQAQVLVSALPSEAAAVWAGPLPVPEPPLPGKALVAEPAAVLALAAAQRPSPVLEPEPELPSVPHVGLQPAQTWPVPASQPARPLPGQASAPAPPRWREPELALVLPPLAWRLVPWPWLSYLRLPTSSPESVSRESRRAPWMRWSQDASNLSSQTLPAACHQEAACRLAAFRNPDSRRTAPTTSTRHWPEVSRRSMLTLPGGQLAEEILLPSPLTLGSRAGARSRRVDCAHLLRVGAEAASILTMTQTRRGDGDRLRSPCTPRARAIIAQ